MREALRLTPAVVAVLLLCLLAGPGAAPAVPAASAGRGHPSVLFAGCWGSGGCHLRTWSDWQNAGFEIAVLPIGKADRFEVLRRFNAVVVDFLPSVDASGRVRAEQIEFEKSLQRYLESGGGVVVLAGGGQWGRMTPALNHLLAPYAAEVPEEQVVDPGHPGRKVGIGSEKLITATTRDIARAPMTRGISRIAYIAQTVRADAIKMTQPIVLPPASPWQVVVRAEATAFPAVAERRGRQVVLRRAPRAGSGPPILAASRKVGKGRLFLFPHNVAATVTSPELFGDYLWNRRDQTQPDVPQNRSLLMQAVRWAAEPSLSSGVFGGYQATAQDRPDRKFILPASRPIDWASAPSAAHAAPALGNLRGLIGAQSTLSGGPESVAALSRAARAAGLSFLGFTERLDRLDPKKWARLQAECKRQSDDHFLAIPGIEARDEAGNRIFALGWAAFPKPPSITSDGRRIADNYRFWKTSFGGRFVGYAEVNENPNPWYEMKQVSAMAVVSRTKGGTDDATRAFLHSSYDMENYIPVSFTEVRTSAGVTRDAAGPVNVFAGHSIEQLRAYVSGDGPYTGKAMFWEDPHPWYLSSGPRLAYDGGIRLGSLGVNEEAENTYRYGFRIDGLEAGDRVLLMDGPTIYREWRAAGSSFSTEHTWPHEQARAFLVRVIRGDREILTSSPVSLQWGRRFNQCGDRQDSIPYNYEPDDSGHWYVTGTPIAPKYKAWPPITRVYGTFKSQETGAIGVEYTPVVGVGWRDIASVPLPASESARWNSLASYQHQALSCPGIIVVDETTNRIYPRGGRHGPDSTPPKPTRPLEPFEVLQRRYGLYGAVGQLNGQLVESRIRALKTVTLTGQHPALVASAFGIPPDASMSVETRLHGEVQRHALDGSTRLDIDEAMKAGDYFGVYPYGLARGGALYAVSGNLLGRLRIDGARRLIAQFLLKVPAHWKAGDHFDYSILYTTGGSVPNEPRSDYTSAAVFLGLDGAFPAIARVDGGKLLPEPVIATIRTHPEDVVRLETKYEPDAPLGLPIRLRGYNPNWQVVYTLDGSRRWRYMGELDGDFYFHLYTQQRAHSVVAGQPLLADQPNLRITLDDPLGRQSAFELYNPTSKPMHAHIRTNPTFFPAREFDVTVPPYTSKNLRVDGGT